ISSVLRRRAMPLVSAAFAQAFKMASSDAYAPVSILIPPRTTVAKAPLVHRCCSGHSVQSANPPQELFQGDIADSSGAAVVNAKVPAIEVYRRRRSPSSAIEGRESLPNPRLRSGFNFGHSRCL